MLLEHLEQITHIPLTKYFLSPSPLDTFTILEITTTAD